MTQAGSNLPSNAQTRERGAPISASRHEVLLDGDV